MDEFIMIRSASNRREDTTGTDVESTVDADEVRGEDSKQNSRRALSVRGKVMNWRTNSYRSLTSKRSEGLEDQDENESPLRKGSTLKRRHQSYKKLTEAKNRASVRFRVQQEKLNQMLFQRIVSNPPASATSGRNSGDRFNLNLTDSSYSSSENPLFSTASIETAASE